MNPMARKMRKNRFHSTISIERLFTAAFEKPRRVYQHESLMGWRPLDNAHRTGFAEAERPARRDAENPGISSPDVKIREVAGSILIEVTLPRIDEESLYLEVADDLLIIQAEKAMPDETVSHQNPQRQPSMVHRFIKLPVAAKPGTIKARLYGNVVRVEIRKLGHE